MKLKSKFAVALIIFSAVLVIFCGAFLIYVNIIVSEYDRVQPENIVEEQINSLKNGSLLQQIDFEKLCVNKYENNDPEKFRQAYAEKVVGKELSYRLVAAESGELLKTYVIKCGEENVGKIILSGKNPRTNLLFFTCADWSLSAFIPTVSDTVYNLRVCVPEGITATINGVEPSEDDREALSGVKSYAISGLLNDPEIKFADADGKEIAYTVEENVVKPILFDYSITLPKDAKIFVNEKEISGTPSGKNVVYRVREMEEPDILIKDAAGAGYKYIAEEEIPLYGYSVSIPENCTLSVEGITLSEPDIIDAPDAESLLKYAGVTLPKQKNYAFSLFGDSVKATVSDGTNTKTFGVSQGSSYISPETLETVPESIAKEVNVLEVMKLWSKFMTNDIGGGDKGYSTILKYLIPDSEYAKYAKQWAYGIDITFVSAHVLLKFKNESVSNFMSYTDNCFSCNVYFEKEMALYKNEKYVRNKTDVFNSIVYFTKISDGSWRIAVMHDNLGGENND